MDNICPIPVANRSANITSSGNNNIVHDGFTLKIINIKTYATQVYPKFVKEVYTLDSTKVCFGSFAFNNKFLLSTKDVIAEFVPPLNNVQKIFPVR